jgi:hypothetical protein
MGSSPRDCASCSDSGSGSGSEAESASSSQESATGLDFLVVDCFVLEPVVFFVGRVTSGIGPFSPMERLRRVDWSSALGSDIVRVLELGWCGG